MDEGRFLLVGIRDGDDVAEAEHLDFLRSTGLPAHRLEHRRILAPSDGLPNLADYDGVFVGGSPFSVTDLEHPVLQKHVHDLMYAVVKSPTPALMICYGSSYAAFAGRGRVDRSYPERAGVSRVELTEAAAADPVFGALPRTFEALTGHKECVAELPRGAVLMATGPTCPVQAYRANRSTWVTQYHPEMDADGLLLRMGFYQDAGYFSRHEIEEIAGIVRAADLAGAEAVMRSFVRHCLTRPGRRED
ncbi:glutamine amidotransferase-related protein [Corynebacterium sp. 335C]